MPPDPRPGPSTLDWAIQIERRRIFWQRVFSETLAAMVPHVTSQFLATLATAEAAKLAGQAVQHFDEWEETQRAQAPNETPPTGDAGDGDEDDPDDQYLGR